MSQHLFARAISSRAAELGLVEHDVLDALVFAPTKEALRIKKARTVQVGRDLVIVPPPREFYQRAGALLADSQLSREKDRGDEHDIGLGWCALALEELHRRLGWEAHAPFERSRLLSSEGMDCLLPPAAVRALCDSDRATKPKVLQSNARAAYRRDDPRRPPLTLRGLSEDEAIEIMLDGHRRVMAASSDALERQFWLYIWV